MTANTPETQPSKHSHNRRVHMANERTFLAWVRTSIAIMAFGFVVERFSIFVKQMAYFAGKETSPPPTGYSAIIGVALVGLGVVMGILSFFRYKKVEQQINDDSYEPSVLLSVLLFLSVLSIGIFLLLYLVHSMVK
jgi:uncharacterized membrane protein YidH (DUF202 family)